MALPSRLLAAVLSGSLLLLIGCRGDVETFEPPDLVRGETGRLTFSASDDRSPAWTPSGDAILYHTNGLVGVDSGPGVLVRISVASGSAQALFPTVQSPDIVGEQWLLAPTPRPDGAAVAFAEIAATWPAHPCELNLVVRLVCTPARSPAEAEQPPLQLIAIHARELETAGPLSANPTFEFRAEGTQIVPGAPKLSITVDHPYQQLFARDRPATFRPTWSPDGTRLAFSDGLRLLIWTVGSGTPEPVPNSEDGVWPAWSPDGEWIAFTRLERADSTGVFCDYRGSFGTTVCSQQRKEYLSGAHVLSLIRPDGGELRELAEGDEPAWAPDGSALYFTAQNRIMSVPVGGGSPQAVPGTENGREPAVSPDGRLLAFAKLEEDNHNIWVVQLAQ
jgi:hypothetical protein